MATATTEEELELKTYWCHECDMSVALTSSSSSSSPSPSSPPPPPPLLCPHCHTHFLELMDSPLSPFPHFDADPFPSSTLSLFDTPFLRHLLHHKDLHLQDSIPTTVVTSSLLSTLDPCGDVVLCAVCKDPIGIDEEAKHLPCNHLYHSDCITPWLAHHASCPLCRFQLSPQEQDDDDDDDDDGDSRARGIEGQLRAAMVRLSELMEEEDDFYGLRTTLNHIATRHGILSSAAAASRVNEEDRSEAGNGDLDSVSRFSVERRGE